MTTPQLDLFAGTIADATGGRDLSDHEATLAERFARFHSENPIVYETLVRLARRGRDHGRDRLGIAALYEVARWELSMKTSGDEFKINNSFRAFYARLIMARNPDLDGVFETRAQRAA